MAASIYILASERSGTNLLRSLLSNHPLYEGPIPIHFFDTFFHSAARYGDLREQAAMQMLLQDAITIANHPYHDWQLHQTAEKIYQAYQPKNLFAAFQALNLTWCETQGKSSMICKDNNLFNYAHYIRANDPSAKFIYLYRDVRAYCASWKGVPAMFKTTYQNAKHWVAEQTICLRLMEIHGIDAVPVSYEELVRDTSAVMDRIFDYVGVPTDSACYQNSSGKNAAAAERNEFWKNIDKPVFDKGAESYRKKLDADEIAMIEKLAGPIMEKLGYAKEAQYRWKKPKFFSFREKLRKKKLQQADFKGNDLLNSKTELVRKIQRGEIISQ